MKKREMLERLSQDDHGVLKTSDAVNLGISKPYFLELIKKEYEKMAHGIYLAPDAWEDGMYILQSRCQQAVFSHEAALYLLDLAEREPLRYTVTVKKGYRTTNITAQGVNVYTVRVYNAERTICDILQSRSQVEIQDRQAALKGYVRRKDRNIPLLMEYAKEFKVDKTLRTYLEVLL